MTVNKLKQNSDKTEFFLFRSKFKPSPMLLPITVATDTICSKYRARNIRVTFDSTRTISLHIVKLALDDLRNIAKTSYTYR